MLDLPSENHQLTIDAVINSPGKLTMRIYDDRQNKVSYGFLVLAVSLLSFGFSAEAGQSLEQERVALLDIQGMT